MEILSNMYILFIQVQIRGSCSKGSISVVCLTFAHLSFKVFLMYVAMSFQSNLPNICWLRFWYFYSCTEYFDISTAVQSICCLSSVSPAGTADKLGAAPPNQISAMCDIGFPRFWKRGRVLNLKNLWQEQCNLAIVYCECKLNGFWRKCVKACESRLKSCRQCDFKTRHPLWAR